MFFRPNCDMQLCVGALITAAHSTAWYGDIKRRKTADGKSKSLNIHMHINYAHFLLDYVCSCCIFSDVRIHVSDFVTYNFR